jgi:hypothetical protein
VRLPAICHDYPPPSNPEQGIAGNTKHELQILLVKKSRRHLQIISHDWCSIKIEPLRASASEAMTEPMLRRMKVAPAPNFCLELEDLEGEQRGTPLPKKIYV